MNEDEMIGMSDTGMGAEGSVPPTIAETAPPEGEADPATQFTDMVIEAIRPVIMDVVNQVLGAAQGAGM